MGKTRVGVLLRESVGGNKSTNKSQDLAALTAKYHEFCKKIRALIDSLKAHHGAMQKIEESRSQVSLRTYFVKILATLHEWKRGQGTVTIVIDQPEVDQHSIAYPTHPFAPTPMLLFFPTGCCQFCLNDQRDAPF